MKNKNIKSFTAFILSFIIVLTSALPAFAVTSEETPIIYVADMEDIKLYEYPDTLNQKVVLDTNSGEFLTAAAKILLGVSRSSDKGVNNTVADVVNGISSIMRPIACNASGNSKNAAVGPLNYDLPISQYPGDPINTATITAIANAVSDKTDRDHFYVFLYDWRLDPAENAASLLKYIERVITVARCTGVSLISAGYGGVVTNTYLYKYRSHAAQNIQSCVFLNCPLMGNAVIGDLMKGKITKTAEDDNSVSGALSTIKGEERADALVRYLNDDPNNIISNLLQKLIGTDKLDQLVSAFIKILFLSIFQDDGAVDLGKSYNNFALLAGNNIYSSCLSEYLRNMPGLWALVPTKDYTAAVDFLYDGSVSDYEFNRKLEGIRAVVDNTASTLKYAQADGIKMYVVANYGRQLLPATVSLNDVSDGMESTKYASAGAITTECGSEWSYNVNCMHSKYHDHRAPDNDIEANTCALPENTWFIKDLKHMDFQYDTAAKFVAWLVTSNTQRNIWESAEYPQYLIYSKTHKNISPYSAGGSSGENYILGDIDLDGSITSADARAVLRYSVQLDIPSKIMRIVADVDGDKSITPSDARLVLRYSVGIISNFPADNY